MFKFMLPTTLTIEPRHSWQKESNACGCLKMHVDTTGQNANFLKAQNWSHFCSRIEKFVSAESDGLTVDERW